MEDVITTSQICARCAVTREALRQWRDLGMPYRAISPKVYIYSRRAVLRWLEERLPQRAELWRAHEATEAAGKVTP